MTTSTPRLARRYANAIPMRRRRASARLRGEFFARAGEMAARYGLRFEDVLAHLWRARSQSMGLRLRNVAHIEDLVLAAACARASGRAWGDLAVLHERTLIRRCRDCRDELEATVQVRRMFSELRREALAGGSALGGFTGVRPLKAWLSEALHRARQRERRAMFTVNPEDTACDVALTFTHQVVVPTCAPPS